jgi:hypothetical protein
MLLLYMMTRKNRCFGPKAVLVFPWRAQKPGLLDQGSCWRLSEGHGLGFAWRWKGR